MTRPAERHAVTGRDRGTGRIVVDLERLPVALRYAIALTVTALVVAAAWYVGRGRTTPHWILAYLVPALGIAGLVLVVTGTVARLLRR